MFYRKCSNVWGKMFKCQRKCSNVRKIVQMSWGKMFKCLEEKYSNFWVIMLKCLKENVKMSWGNHANQANCGSVNKSCSSMSTVEKACRLKCTNSWHWWCLKSPMKYRAKFYCATAWESGSYQHTLRMSKIGMQSIVWWVTISQVNSTRAECCVISYHLPGE